MPPIHIDTFEPPKAYEPKNVDTTLSDKHSVVEPKLDGVRGIVHCHKDGVIITTRRKNKAGEYTQLQDNFPHLRDHATLKALAKDGYTILDCEILAPTDTDSLGKIMSLVGSKAPRAVSLQEQFGKAYITLFDVSKFRGNSTIDKPWTKRRQILEKIKLDQYIKIIPYVVCKTTEERRRKVAEYIEAGYEGAVFKNPDAAYFESRAWLKHKTKYTIDAIVTGWTAGKGQFENTLGALVVSVYTDKKNKKLKELCTVAPGTIAKRNELYKTLKDLTYDQIVALNLIVEIEGQQATEHGSVRHPRIVKWREDKSTPTTIKRK